MRLHVQRGLSSRVLRALQLRLSRAMASANDSQTFGGAATERTRSRSRGREHGEVEETPGVDAVPPEHVNEVPDAPEGNPGVMAGGPDMPEGIPTPPKGASRNELMQKLINCAEKVGSVNEDMVLVLDEFKDSRKDLQAGFKQLADQLAATTHAITTMSGGVSHQSGEVTKLLKAFDRWSNAARWTLKGDNSIEQNIQNVQTEICNQATKLESRVSVGFEICQEAFTSCYK